MSNVHSLFSGANKKDDDDEDSSNNRYVGGIGARGGGSGLAVEPNNQDEDDATDPRDSVFAQAENAGPNASGDVRRTITMYRNGFIVDDGPYRRLDDSSNADFLRSLARGMTPRELLGEGDVTVGLIDKRSEDYQETFQSFSGTGASLGTKSTSEKDTDTAVDPATLPEQPPPVDASQPTTSIQVRTANGKRKVVKINLSSSILDLAAHLRDVADGPFRLLAGFPPKPIEDLSQSVEAAGLKGASINMQAA